MYKLYGSPKSRAGRVIWMLEELGVPYELIAAAPHSPEIVAVNPSGKIPVLVDGDLALSDSTAILFHLADKHGKLTFPAGSPERARMTAALCFATDAIEQPLWTLAKHTFVLPEEVRQRDAIEPACRFEWKRAMKALEAMIGDGPFVMGETFTIADVTLGHLGAWGKANGFEAREGAVADYMDRVRSRPGWRAVVKAREAA